MKNFVKTIVLALAMLCTATTASAQLEGSENAIGFNLGYGLGNHEFSNFGIGVRYCRHLSDALRIDLNGMYYFKNGLPGSSVYSGLTKAQLDDVCNGKATDWFDVNINGHYLFEVAEKMYVYPVFGFSTMFGKTNFKWNEVVANEQAVPEGQKYNDSYSNRHFRFGVNLGFGGQYNITDDFGLTLEAKYKLVNSGNKFGHLSIALGCAVLF